MPGLLPPLGPMPFLPHQWTWDGREHVDPQKEANAQDTRLRAGTTHRNREYARDGLDVDAEDAIAAASYGVTIQEYRRRLFDVHFPQSSSTNAAPNDSEDDRTEPESDGHESEETAEAQAAGV